MPSWSRVSKIPHQTPARSSKHPPATAATRRRWHWRRWLSLPRGLSLPRKRGDYSKTSGKFWIIQLMEEILHRLIDCLSIFLQGFIHPNLGFEGFLPSTLPAFFWWLHPGRLTWNLKMMVWKMIFRISIGWILGSMWIFRGVHSLKLTYPTGREVWKIIDSKCHFGKGYVSFVMFCWGYTPWN